MAPKRTSGRIRQEHREQGALLLKFLLPDGEAFEGVRRACLDERFQAFVGQMGLEAGNVLSFGTMQRKGYRITVDTGCCSPDRQYRWSAGNERARGYGKVYKAMHGATPPAGAGNDPVTGQAEYTTLSHLCKRGGESFGCVNRRHIDLEAWWRNALRNYCRWVEEEPADPRRWPVNCACVAMLRLSVDGLRAQGRDEEADRIEPCIGRPCLRAYIGRELQEAEIPVIFGVDQKAACQELLTLPGGKGGEYVWAPDGTEINDANHALKACWENEAMLARRDQKGEQRAAKKQRQAGLEAQLDAVEAGEAY